MLQAAGRMARRRSRLSRKEYNFLGVIPRHSFNYGNIASHNLQDTGITIRNEMPDLDATGRSVYAAPFEHTGRRQRMNMKRMEEARRTVPHVSAKGVRGTTAVTILFVLVVALGMVWLVNRAGMTATYKHISDLQRRIEIAQENLTDLEEQYAAAAASVDVGYKAVDLGMISTRNMAKIYLYVPENAENGPLKTVGGLYTSQLAAITGD